MNSLHFLGYLEQLIFIHLVKKFRDFMELEDS
jgi:hypothetical protein